jgi:hypothetical protein
MSPFIVALDPAAAFKLIVRAPLCMLKLKWFEIKLNFTTRLRCNLEPVFEQLGVYLVLGSCKCKFLFSNTAG